VLLFLLRGKGAVKHAVILGFMNKLGVRILPMTLGTRKRRYIIMMVCLVVLFTIVSCGGKKDSEVPANESTNESRREGGYIDKTGGLGIEAIFDGAWGFSEGLALVNIDGRYGYIDKQGSIVIEPRDYASAEINEEKLAFSEGMALIPMNGRWGYIDNTGDIVIETRFAEAYPFSDGLAQVRLVEEEGGKIGFINKNGDFAIEPRYDWCLDFTDGLAFVGIKGDTYGFIDTTGRMVIGQGFYSVTGFSEGLAAIPADHNTKMGYIDKNGEWAIDPVYLCPNEGAVTLFEADFSDGLALVWINDDQGNRQVYIDKTGNVAIVPPERYYNNPFHDGLAIFERSGSLGYIDKSGDIVVEPQLRTANNFSEGLALVEGPKTNHFYGFIDKSGKMVIEPQFVDAWSFSEGLAPVKVR